MLLNILLIKPVKVQYIVLKYRPLARFRPVCCLLWANSCSAGFIHDKTSAWQLLFSSNLLPQPRPDHIPLSSPPPSQAQALQRLTASGGDAATAVDRRLCLPPPRRRRRSLCWPLCRCGSRRASRRRHHDPTKRASVVRRGGGRAQVEAHEAGRKLSYAGLNSRAIF